MSNKLTIVELAKKTKLYVEILPTEDFYGKIVITFEKGKPRAIFTEEKFLASNIK